MLITIGNKTFKTATVGLFCFNRKTADVIPEDIDKACGVKKQKCIRTVIYKSKCNRVQPSPISSHGKGRLRNAVCNRVPISCCFFAMWGTSLFGCLIVGIVRVNCDWLSSRLRKYETASRRLCCCLTRETPFGFMICLESSLQMQPALACSGGEQ